MSGRILVVDDLETNRRLLKIRLEAEYYDVAMAESGFEALDMAFADPPDLILLDVMMPKMDGMETCRRLKSDLRTRQIPVIMVTALDQREDRVRGLEAGADDFLSKPWDDAVLLARVRSMLRLKAVTDELEARQASGQALGAIDEHEEQRVMSGARVLVVDDPTRASERLARRLEHEHRPRLETDAASALRAARGPWDLVILDTAAETFDGMRLAARLRSDEATRSLPILAIVDEQDKANLFKALDIGVNDVLGRPVDGQELAARVRTLVKRKRYADYLRATLDETLEQAVTDHLTGLYNRRFMEIHLRELMDEALGTGRPLSLLLVDLDHFKRINDAYGHEGGDDVLVGFAARLAAHVRSVDMACRAGGEEFAILMPGADADTAKGAAERLRLLASEEPFRMRNGGEMAPLTVSIGLTQLDPDDTAAAFVRRADQALSAAKTQGRNRVMAARKRRDAA